MEEEKKCYQKFKERTKCPVGTPKEITCFKPNKKEIPCNRRKRCEGGVLKYDDLKTGRLAGQPCKDDREGR